MQDDALGEDALWPSDSGGAVASAGPPETGLYRCPQCNSGILLDATACSNCGAPFARTESFVDLTPESTAKKTAQSDLLSQASRNPFLSVALSQLGAQLSGQPLRQELFRTPVVSYLYERGWRESFKQAGFPGIEKEYELAMEFFQEARGKTVMDLSCGSGLMVRRFAKSGEFARVVAVDYSESMLEEVDRRKKEEQCPDFDLVRADVANLPFASDGIPSSPLPRCLA
jgi:DNA-directed RNA polymerase subunit RPC12/RpoP